ncbi:MAG: glycoside hydrolase family 16 protein [Intrasporangium sp.]|nr:glycoside hydrolase family 16 protein [Intrasporangium sp.]
MCPGPEPSPLDPARRAAGAPPRPSPAAYGTVIDDFDGPQLDRATWLPHYLPAWSSRRETAASYRLGGSCLTLEIPLRHPLWCPDEHEVPLRVSGIQSGNQSGPVGSTRGQQPFLDGQTVREEQPRFEGLLMDGGRFEIRCAMRISPRSMAAAWLVGFEDEPERCGELCVVEIFGRTVEALETVTTVEGDSEPTTAEVGMGVHAFRDPSLTEDFVSPRLQVDPSRMHTYAVEWDSRGATHLVDDVLVRRTPAPPAYPLQVMIAVFDFPDWSDGSDEDLVPAIIVDRVAWRPAR